MDFLPEPSDHTFDNLLDTLVGGEIADAIVSFEHDMACVVADESPDVLTETILDYSAVLNEMFGQQYRHMPARVTALGFAITHGDEINEPPRFIDSMRAVFYEVGIRQIEGAYRVVLEFDPSIFEDSNDCAYVCVRASDALRLEIQPGEDVEDDEEDMCTVFAHHAANAIKLTSSRDFLRSPAEVQHQLMASVIGAMDSDLSAVFGDYEGMHVRLVADEFYVLHDDMAMFDVAMLLTDQTRLKDSQRSEISGTIVGMVYPELVVEPEVGFHASTDFTLSEGAPCIIVHNPEKNMVYFVKPHTLRAIIPDNSDAM